MFNPPFCPYKSCERHAEQGDNDWWRHDGYHLTKTFGRVSRFQCLSCKRTFSVQTFSLDYYAKRRLPFARLERLAASSMSIRALGCEFRASCGTIVNRIDRLARQGIAMHTALRPEALRNEPICFDGFVSFERSQYFPADIGISITAASRYVLGVSHATTKRSGRMTDCQKERQELLYTGTAFEKKAIERSLRQHLDMFAAERNISKRRPLVLITDEKIEYARALMKHALYRDQTEDQRCIHVRISSSWPRTRSNPLFASNYYDRELRKDQAQHRRETTCFARKAVNDMNRLYAYLVWHNYAKRYSLKWPAARKETHAEIAGIARKRLMLMRKKMFAQRFFLSHLSLLPIDLQIWMKAIQDPISQTLTRPIIPRFAVA